MSILEQTRFLQTLHPFERLDQAWLEQAASALDVVYFAKDDKVDCPVLKHLLLDCEGERYGFGVNVQPAYRFTLHSLRRFFLTLYYHVESDRDLVMTQFEIGHQLKDTTLIYIKRPADIGLTDSLMRSKLDFESLFYSRSQLTLEDFK